MSNRQQSKVARLDRSRKTVKNAHGDLHLLGKRFMWHCHYCHRSVHCARCLWTPSQRDDVLAELRDGPHDQTGHAA